MMQLDLPRTALVVIDMQRDFLDAGGYAARAGMDIAPLRAAIAPVQQVLQAARAADVTVVHTREGHLPDLSDCPPYKLQRSRRAGAEIGAQGPMGRLLVRGERGHDFIDALQPRPGELVIDKPGYGAFEGTTLGQALVVRGITTLLLCGITTEVCVSSTLRSAVDRGYRCFTIGDACAAADPDLHAAALRMIEVEGGIFGTVVASREVREALAAARAI
jgi:nicotinamidase-related amidase